MRFADLDAVTIDAFGTLVELIDPVPALAAALAESGVVRAPDEIREAVQTESRYYRAHLAEGRDPESLERLRVRCTGVFLDALGADLAAETFMPEFISSLRFRPLEGVEPALYALCGRGLTLAVVANWDISLIQHLEGLALRHFFSVVEPLADKPSGAGLLRTLETLRVAPNRTLHIGDELGDESAAASAGAHYLPAPLTTALDELR
jgi:phosphoglycolate phosphatase-like HAD superfamily hydrolase